MAQTNTAHNANTANTSTVKDGAQHMTVPVIANRAIGGYAQPKNRQVGTATMGDPRDDEQERAELERQVRAGVWLKTGPVAKLLRLGRTKTHTLLTKGEIGYRIVAGGTQRECDPEDVLRLLEGSRKVHRPGRETE